MTKLNFLDPWTHVYAYEQQKIIPVLKHGGGSILYEGHYGLFEVSGHFGKDCDAFDTETETDDHCTAEQISNTTHPELLAEI